MLDELRNALTVMPATGDRGFEGLSATLLSALTGYRFYVARAGDQPADAVSASGDIALQSKRYNETALDKKSFLADFYDASRSCPWLDCYVLAATRTVAQVSVLAAELQQETGIDVILLGINGTASDIPALVVTFWSSVQHFPKLKDLGAGFTAWAAREARRPEVVATIQRLRETLTQSTTLFTALACKATHYLDARFGITSSDRIGGVPIDIQHAVPRQLPMTEFTRWWQDANSRSAVVIGEEGMGKSTVAAAFAHELATASLQLVLWLDSVHWTGVANIEAAIDRALMLIGYTDPRVRERVTRKALTRWSRRLLIVFDGVNERNSRDTAHRLLSQAKAPETLVCRLLFTTRPISWASDQRSLWRLTTQIPVDRFTESELQQALSTLEAPIPRTEIPEALIQVASIPRYFRRAVELRGRFKSLSNITKEMVLWADLLTKIQSDQQVRDKIGWTSAADIKRALRKLAKEAQAVKAWPDPSSDGYALLQSSFGQRFEEIRSDLSEQRVVLEPDSDNPHPSPEHVILGFALHLAEIAAGTPSLSIVDLADRVHKELEPVLAQDQLTEAIFVALQLSAFPDANAVTLSSKARSGLLLAWTASQNSKVEEERLRFWAAEDMRAYVDFVEEVFIQPVSDSWTDVLIEPLRTIWRRNVPAVILNEQIRRWVKLFWRSHDLPAGGEFLELSHALPVARSQSQLALSFVALAIVSEKPIDDILLDLAIASGTARLSTERHQVPKSPGSKEEEPWDVTCKNLHNNLGPVLRWRFTERVKPKLTALGTEYASDAVITRGIDRLLTEFDTFGWQISKDAQSLREGNALFPLSDERRENRFCTCPELAVRDDLPALCTTDQEAIATRLERAFVSPHLHEGYYHTEADADLEYHLSWFARYDGRKLIDISSRFRLSALARRDAARALDLANQLPYDDKIVSTSELFRAAKSFVEREIDKPPIRFRWSILETHVLAFTCFTPEELKEWLLFSSQHKLLRREIHYYPIPLLAPLLVRDELASFARNKARECWPEPPDMSDFTEAEFDFWACIGGVAGPADSDYHGWIDFHLRQGHYGEHRRFYSALLWFRTTPDTALQRAVNDGTILELFAADGFRPMLSSGRLISDWSPLSIDADSIAQKLPLDDVGTLLLEAGRERDLAGWGEKLFRKAFELLHVAPPERQFWGGTVYTRNDAGRITAADCDREEQIGEVSGDPLRPIKPTQIAALYDTSSIEEQNRQANDALKIWRADIEALSQVEKDAYNRFGAYRALMHWRDAEPQSFQRSALKILDRAVAHPADAYHLGGFIAAIIDALVPLSPRKALEVDQALRSSLFRVNVINDYGESSFEATMWSQAGRINDCRLICRQWIESAPTDEKLMSHAVIAQAEGVGAELVDMCDELLQSPLAKQRSLAVSLLPWIADDAQIGQLRKLAQTDVSGWIKAHAEWASEVAQQENAMRKYYAQTLEHLDDANEVMVRLQVLKPALTPTAYWWHRKIEDNSMQLQTAAAKTKAALTCFWYDFRSKSRNKTRLFGRDIADYLRGEKITDLRPPRPRLLDE